MAIYRCQKSKNKVRAVPLNKLETLVPLHAVAELLAADSGSGRETPEEIYIAAWGKHKIHKMSTSLALRAPLPGFYEYMTICLIFR